MSLGGQFLVHDDMGFVLFIHPRRGPCEDFIDRWKDHRAMTISTTETKAAA